MRRRLILILVVEIFLGKGLAKNLAGRKGTEGLTILETQDIGAVMEKKKKKKSRDNVRTAVGGKGKMSSASREEGKKHRCYSGLPRGSVKDALEEGGGGKMALKGGEWRFWKDYERMKEKVFQ